MHDTSRSSSQVLFEKLVSQLREYACVLTDTDGVFITWNPGVLEQLGYQEGEFIGQNSEILFPTADRLKGIPRQEFETAIEKGRASDTRWLVKKGGQRIWVEGVTIRLNREDGTLVGFGKVMQNVTERKGTEDSLVALTKALDHSTVIVRRWDGIIEHWTAGCERLYGYSASEAVGRVCRELLRTKSRIPLEQIEEELVKRASWFGELDQLRKDGSTVSVAAHWALFSDGIEDQPAVIESYSDITSRIQMQAEWEAANERLKSMTLELERSNQELEQFARIASHDLSAPITSTRWLVDLLGGRYSGQLSPEGKAVLDQIGKGLERMGDLVESILAHARAGRDAISSSDPVDANEAFAVALENLRKDISVSGAVITSDKLPQVLIEKSALIQLLQNLLSNAIKYRRSGVAPIIHVAAEPRNSKWLISVTDNGIGIEPQWFERIFQPLQRLHGFDISGSGIGLATCRKIVTRAGGEIWVESEYGSGSTFRFTLPGRGTSEQR